MAASLALNQAGEGSNPSDPTLSRFVMTHRSSSGRGHRIRNAETRVRIPLGALWFFEN